MPRRLTLALLAVCALAAAGVAIDCSIAVAPALAAEPSQNPLEDQGSSPNYRSLIRSISPSLPGLSLQVLQFSDRLQLRNHSGKTVTIEGYEGEPYARVQADGTVEVNKHSPAYYLNQSFYGNVIVPAFASPKAAPLWSVVDRTGQFEWHDHRIHWMSPVLPPQVKDKGKRTLIFDWHVPISVGARRGAVGGQLFWTPESSAAPVAAIVIGGAIVVLGLLLVVIVRHRRPPRRVAAATSPSAGEAGTGEEHGKDGAVQTDHREAW